MDEKMMDILVANGIATGKCIDGVDRVSKSVYKLANKLGRQTLLNLIAGFFLYLSVVNIGGALVKIEKLEKKIENLELEKREESKTKKGV